jgi:hypothetical protein
MNQNELRIGNWIYTGSDFDKHGLSFVYSISPSCITTRTNGVYQGYNPEDISGIPLTAEILIKCGFRQILDNYLFEKVINESLTLNVYKEGISLHSKGCTFEITLPVFHLHRLQNLWFELTNTELEYK